MDHIAIKTLKSDLRKSMFKKRGEFNPELKETYDAWICSELERIISERKCKTVHAFLPFLSEINIYPLLTNLLENGITVVCPKTLPKHQLENRKLISLDQLEEGIKKTLHPTNREIYTGKYDLIIVPGLAFDSRNYRLGYGGGYYDNFLVNQKEAYKLGIFYPFQQVEKVPLEPHDIAFDAVLFKDLKFFRYLSTL